MYKRKQIPFFWGAPFGHAFDLNPGVLLRRDFFILGFLVISQIRDI